MNDEADCSFEPAFGRAPDFGALMLRDARAGDVPGSDEIFAPRGRPPSALAHLHDEHFFEEALQRVIAQVRDPVRVGRTPEGARAVQILGQSVFAFDAQGRISVSLWGASNGVDPVLESISSEAISIDPVPYGEVWLQRFEKAFVIELRRLHALRSRRVEPEDLRAYGAWAFRIFRNEIRRHCDLRVMRRRIALALGLDACALAIARRLRRRYSRQAPIRVDDYNLVLTHRDAFDTLRRDAANLLRLYALFCEREDFPRDGEPVRALKQFLRSQSLSERAWRMIANSRARLIDPVLDFYHRSLPDATLDFLRLLDAIGLHREPPHWFIWDLLRVHGNPEQRRTDYLKRSTPIRPVHRHLVALIERADAAELERIREGLYPVLDWAFDARPRRLESRQQGAGWPWLVRQACQWAEVKRETAAREGRAWPVPFESVCAGAWRIAALANAAALWEEGYRMRHCADGMVEHCLRGRLLIFSIREADSDRRVATASYQFDGDGWELSQVAGFANHAPRRSVGAALIAISAALSAFVTSAFEAEEEDGSADPADEAVAHQRLIDAVVPLVRRGQVLDGELVEAMAEWAAYQYPRSLDCLEVVGTLLPADYADDWKVDPQCWIERAVGRGRIGPRRGAALLGGATLRDREERMLRRYFTDWVLSGEADCDRYPAWFAIRVRANTGAHAWVLGVVCGYAFSGLRVGFAGAFASRRAMQRALSDIGVWR